MSGYPSVRTAKERMGEVLEKLDAALKAIHTGRASAALVENIPVMAYGQSTPVKAIAQLSVPEANQVAVTPWDPGQLTQIEAAIRESDLGVSPVSDGRTVRVIFPPMTTERRAQLTKELGKIAEEARVALRNVRHEALETIKRDVEQDEATEDDKFSVQKELDDLIKAKNDEVEALIQKKTVEIQQV
ncbi:MAG: ribosome recycling factor [Patescibacteria group bacterium]|jgi:ribosome recycling factor